MAVSRTTSVRKVGGSLMFAIPKATAEELAIGERSTLSLTVEDGRLVAVPERAKPRYRIEDLVAQCDLDAPIEGEDRDWYDMPDIGRERDA
jgi:antitoxin ChpS